jgi:hypothetical protein
MSLLTVPSEDRETNHKLEEVQPQPNLTSVQRPPPRFHLLAMQASSLPDPAPRPRRAMIARGRHLVAYKASTNMHVDPKTYSPHDEAHPCARPR